MIGVWVSVWFIFIPTNFAGDFIKLFDDRATSAFGFYLFLWIRNGCFGAPVQKPVQSHFQNVPGVCVCVCVSASFHQPLMRKFKYFILTFETQYIQCNILCKANNTLNL